jgi:biotin carboxylase
MNFVYISPHFPPNYYQFCSSLHQLGVNVLGLANEPYDLLRQELKQSLVEYYRVDDMHNYDDLLRACGYFTHKYGKIDRLDSLNEYWLETEAQLRTDFNISGLKAGDMQKIKRKSIMKQMFVKAGIDVAFGKVTHTITEAKRLIDVTGYPIVAKPDIGVGASKTYKIHNPEELERFFAQKPPINYILEQFISGTICSFDGLTDRDGNLVFYTSHQFSQGIMETVNNDDLIYYFSLRDIPTDLEEAGRKTVKTFDVRERFFHFEFFRTPENSLVALEVNMRPPGGLTTDMFNYANNIDIYKEWANIMVYNKFTADYARKYHCAYIGRKFNRSYAHSHEQILNAFGTCCITHHEPISGVFSAALGDYGYIVRSTDLQEIYTIAEYIHTPA